MSHNVFAAVVFNARGRDFACFSSKLQCAFHYNIDSGASGHTQSGISSACHSHLHKPLPHLRSLQ